VIFFFVGVLETEVSLRQELYLARTRPLLHHRSVIEL